MQDRFKFRVWDKENEGWLEDERVSINIDGTLTVLGTDQYGEDCFLNSEDLIIEQCTGLKDKNGRLIYEGDILGYAGNSLSVVWDNDHPSFKIYGKDDSRYGQLNQSYINDYGFEVIGNIHKNPELLEV